MPAPSPPCCFGGRGDFSRGWLVVGGPHFGYVPPHPAVASVSTHRPTAHVPCSALFSPRCQKTATCPPPAQWCSGTLPGLRHAGGAAPASTLPAPLTAARPLHGPARAPLALHGRTPCLFWSSPPPPGDAPSPGSNATHHTAKPSGSAVAGAAAPEQPCKGVAPRPAARPVHSAQTRRVASPVRTSACARTVQCKNGSLTLPAPGPVCFLVFCNPLPGVSLGRLRRPCADPGHLARTPATRRQPRQSPNRGLNL